jgi:translocation and assembly module TamB
MNVRSALRWTLWVLVGASAIVLGAGWSLVRTATGRALVTRWVAETVSAQLNGRLEIGGLTGSVWAGLNLRDVVIIGADSVPIARFPTIDVRYWPIDFLGGRVVLRRLMLVEPDLDIHRDSSGAINIEALVRRESTDSGPGSSPFIAFYDVTVEGGHITLDIDDGPPRTIDSLDASFAELVISSPGERGVGAIVRHLAADMSDPPLRLRELEGQLRLAGDSLEFTDLRLALDRSRVRGEGVFRWPTGDLEATAAIDLEEADAAEFAFLSDLIPRRGTASGAGTIAVGADGAVAIDLDGLRYRDGPTELDGRLAVETDGRRVVVHGISIRTVDADVSLIEPLLDTVPFDGTITGRTELEGPLDALRANLDWAFRDRRAEGLPTTYVTASGLVAIGGDDALVFRGMDVGSASVALATVRTLVPGFALRGRLGMFGMLTGPWRNATLNGTLEHHDEGLPVTVATGRVRLDTRAPSTLFDAEVIAGPLALDGIRVSYPGLAVGGSYRGRIVANGPLDSLALDVDLTIGSGRVRGRSIVGLAPAAVAFTDLDLALDAVDPSTLWVDAPPGSVTLTALGSIVVPDSGAPAGGLRVDVGPSRLAGTPLDTVALAFSVRDELINFEALEADFVGVRIQAVGTLAWRSAQTGRLTVRVAADSLAPLDSLFLWAFPVPDSIPGERLRGAGDATLVVEGPWAAIGVRAEATARDLAWRTFHTPEMALQGRWLRGGADSAWASFGADTLGIGNWGFGGVEGTLAGAVRDLSWTARSRFGRGGATVVGGRLQRTPDTTTVVVDSLRVLLPSGVWTMEQQRRVVATDSAIIFDRFELVPVLGEALLAVEGRLPKAGQAAWALEGRGLHLEDVYDLVEFDTVGIGGLLDVDVVVEGTARDPRIVGSMRLTDGRFRDFSAPLLEGAVTYSDRQLRSNLDLWPSVERAGSPILTMTAQLPLDLALVGAERRRLPGPLEVRANADSVDMSVLGAMTTLMEQVDGTFTADVAIAGSWEEPALTGSIAIRDGAASYPGLNVRHETIYGELILRGDTILVDRMAVRTGTGTLTIYGHVRLIELSQPSMDLSIIANQFELLDVRDQLTLVVSTQGPDQAVKLTGPFIGAQLTGAVLVNEGVLYFRDLLEKRIISLEDSLAREVFSIEELRARGLATPLRTRLLDSLRIRELQLEMGPDVWLRSGEANVQLGGQLTVEKDAGAYRLDGTLNAQRGTYRLPLRVATRQFLVTDGSVQYFGTPDLNAQLDLNASYTVSTVPTENEPEQIEIYAHIGGTLLAPRLTLTSDVEPPLPETEIISYLLFGRPSFQLAATGDPRDNQRFVVQQAAGLLSGELERALVSDLRVPLDYLELRPSDVADGPWVARAGVQLGRKTFVIASATYCPVGQTFLPGATLQYRFSRQWRTEISAEPVNLCRRGSATTLDQQFGIDLLWERRY